MGAYRKELRYGSIEILISETEIKYKTPKQKGIVRASAITGIEVQRGKFLSFGYLKIRTTDDMVSIEFPKKFNAELEEWKNDYDMGKYKAKEKQVKTSKHSTMPIGKMSALTEKNELISAIYNVSGKNPDTGRRKTRQIIRSENMTEAEVEKASGLLPPYEIEKIADEAPTEEQIKYAQKLGVAFPKDASIRDATIFLTRAENYEELHQKGTAKSLLEIYINKYGIYIPKYANAQESYRAFFCGMNKQEKVEYFAMRVYNEYKGTEYMFPFEAEKSEQEIFEKFAQKYIEDKKFMESFLKYMADDLPIGHKVAKQLKAYEIVRGYLQGAEHKGA